MGAGKRIAAREAPRVVTSRVDKNPYPVGHRQVSCGKEAQLPDVRTEQTKGQRRTGCVGGWVLVRALLVAVVTAPADQDWEHQFEQPPGWAGQRPLPQRALPVPQTQQRSNALEGDVVRAIRRHARFGAPHQVASPPQGWRGGAKTRRPWAHIYHPLRAPAVPDPLRASTPRTSCSGWGTPSSPCSRSATTLPRTR